MPSNDETGNGKKGLVVSPVDLLREVIREEVKIRAPMSISVLKPGTTETAIDALSTDKGSGEGRGHAGNDVHRH